MGFRPVRALLGKNDYTQGYYAKPPSPPTSSISKSDAATRREFSRNSMKREPKQLTNGKSTRPYTRDKSKTWSTSFIKSDPETELIEGTYKPRLISVPFSSASIC